jgi:S1-C subfamily serine protease
MYVYAIEQVEQFTRPVHFISRTYGGIVSPGTSTLFFVNEDGVAITCKHVLEVITQADSVNSSFDQFKGERDKLSKDGTFKRKLKELETKYKLKSDTIVQIKVQFVNSVIDFGNIICYSHPTLDLAILIFVGYKEKLYSSHAKFVQDTSSLKQGRSLCRLGYPFPEFSNFQYNRITDDIEWTTTGNPHSPQFPLDGMVTRFGGDSVQHLTIEMSTPGLRGQSGGPLFNSEGLIYGMQFMTSHLHLGFDLIDKEVIAGGKKLKVTTDPFLHVGQCIHVDRIKEFLKQHNIMFDEA